MNTQITDEEGIESEFRKKFREHIQENYPYEISHMGKYGDKCCQKDRINNEEENFDSWMIVNTYGVDKTFYAMVDAEGFTGFLINFELEEPIIAKYK